MDKINTAKKILLMFRIPFVKLHFTKTFHSSLTISTALLASMIPDKPLEENLSREDAKNAKKPLLILLLGAPFDFAQDMLCAFARDALFTISFIPKF
jgi:hypothetical protein